MLVIACSISVPTCKQETRHDLRATAKGEKGSGQQHAKRGGALVKAHRAETPGPRVKSSIVGLGASQSYPESEVCGARRRWLVIRGSVGREAELSERRASSSKRGGKEAGDGV